MSGLDKNIVLKLKERYSELHPLIFHRSLEQSKSLGQLFDILETVPKKFPIIWSAKAQSWVECEDTHQSEEFLKEFQK